MQFKIEQHIECAEQALRRMGIPHVTLDYNQTMQSPAEATARIGEMFGLALSAADLNVQRGPRSQQAPQPRSGKAKRAAGMLPLPMRRALKHLILGAT